MHEFVCVCVCVCIFMSAFCSLTVRDKTKLVGSLAEEKKIRQNAVENLSGAMDEVRGLLSDRLHAFTVNADAKMANVQDQMRGTVDNLRAESERARSLVLEEVKAVAKSLNDEAAVRASMQSSMSIQMNSIGENVKEAISDVQADFSQQITNLRMEENELNNERVRDQEELKGLMASLEKEVFESQASTNAKVDRTRAALEEVLRAEIQSRQTNFSSLESRVRDIITDCLSRWVSLSFYIKYQLFCIIALEAVCL